jgi:hypothetical protein
MIADLRVVSFFRSCIPTFQSKERLTTPIQDVSKTDREISQLVLRAKPHKMFHLNAKDLGLFTGWIPHVRISSDYFAGITCKNLTREKEAEKYR